jgi:transcriptional regulator MraZ
MLRGHSPAKIDGKGRLKVPSVFRKIIEEKYGRDCFVTSTTGEFARVYPMPVWVEIEKKFAALPSMNPTVMRLKNRVNYYGAAASMDDQGRLPIHPLLRRSTALDGDVAVIGSQTWLEVWNREKLEAMLKSHPLTEEDETILSTLGI